MTKEVRKTLIKAQQGELDGVETYKMLAEVVHNEDDVKAFKELSADEGRHAAVFKNYTGEVLKPNKTQAFAVAVLYSLLGKKILYPLIAKFEYAAIPGYEELMKDYPEVETVKDDEKRHGDTLNGLLENGQFNDRPKLPYVCAALAAIFIARLFRRR
ncbi:MAG: rubrerythrin [Lachnospiraceae bacterium]|nr:rubrerythrin [Lachnospiraceae bacterium]